MSAYRRGAPRVVAAGSDRAPRTVAPGHAPLRWQAGGSRCTLHPPAVIMDTPSLLDKILDLLVDTVCVVDAAGRFVFVSASSELLLGYAPDELLGRNMIELVHPDDRERTLGVAAKVMSGVPQAHFENRWLRRDGRPVDIMWSARWSEEDGIRLAVARDVTPLKRAARMQNALFRISEAAHESDDLAALYPVLQRIVGELVPAGNFMVARFDPSTGALWVPYAAGTLAHSTGAPELAAGWPLAEVVRTGRALVTRVGEDGGAHGVAAEGGGNWLAVPLSAHRGVVGVLVLRTEAGEPGYRDDDLELLRFVSTQIATVVERKDAEDQMRHRALHDALTDLPNRALFQDRCGLALRRAARGEAPVVLFYLDVDDFKYVNDAHGHDAGDVLLRAVADRLLQCVRASDTVARIGGDEFTVLVPELPGPDPGTNVLARIRAALAAPYQIDGTELTISVSIGVAVYPVDGVDMDALLRCADERMYADKSDDL